MLRALDRCGWRSRGGSGGGGGGGDPATPGLVPPRRPAPARRAAT
jgi:hypothetical protein